MRKMILLTFLLLSLVAIPAMAVTLTAVTGTLPSGTAAVTSIDNSILYLVTVKGDIYSQSISTGALTKLANISKQRPTAIVTTGTVNYVGLASGKIATHTISGDAVSMATLAICTVPGQAITGMKWDATLSAIWLTTNKGKTYKCTP